MSDALKKALEQLDALNKSQEEQGDDLGALVKALEKAVDPLIKSDDGDADDKGKDDGKGGDKKDTADGGEKKDDDAKPDADQMGADKDKTQKSQADLDNEDALLKALGSDTFDALQQASEAYAGLQKSVEEGMGTINTDVEALKKSVADGIDLNSKIAMAVVGLTKTVQTLVKSMGKQPLMPNKAVIGTGDHDDSDGTLKKSFSEISEALQKAVTDGEVLPQHLTIWGTYRDVERLPAAFRTKLGI